jgi:glutamate racemase
MKAVTNGPTPMAYTAVLDWGIGGLSVLREIRAGDPERPLLYFSDSGFTPYGKLAAPALRDRLEAVIRFLLARGAREVVVACNAASTAAPELRRALPGVELIDVIANGIRLVRRRAPASVAILGGRRTIRSGAYQRALAAPGREVTGRVAQPLSALVERGVLAGPELDAALAPIVRPLRGHEALLIACTHYTAVAPAIQRFLPECELLDPAPSTARELLERAGRSRRRAGPDVFLTTGDPAASRRSAALAFSVDCAFRRVRASLLDPAAEPRVRGRIDEVLA